MGYNFSTIETKVKNIDDENVELIFDITRGDKTQISEIKFTGNKKWWLAL